MVPLMVTVTGLVPGVGLARYHVSRETLFVASAKRPTFIKGAPPKVAWVTDTAEF